MPLRGGSKSIPQKNIKIFNGKPLCYWYLNELNKSEYIDKIIVATDSLEIIDVVKSFKFKKINIFKRSKKNSTDTSSTESVILEFLSSDKFKYDNEDIFLLCQSTSPLTKKTDFEKGIDNLINNNYDSVISVVNQNRFFWNENGTPLNYDPQNRPRRQDFKSQIVENGSFYITYIKSILKTSCRISGKVGFTYMNESSYYEIDEMSDWTVVESLHSLNLKKVFKKNNIKLFVSDVDGVLTDAGMYYSNNGDELKKFNTRDGMAFSLIKNLGIKTALITSEDTKIVSKRSKKLDIDFIYQGKKNKGKLESIKSICNILEINISNVLYIGDDINCLDSLKNVGYPFCPNDAVDIIKEVDNITVLNTSGGHGCIREIYEKYLV